MSLLPLTNDDKARLQRLRLQKDTIDSLKKLFLNQLDRTLPSDKIEFLAAERIALGMVEAVFHQLEIIQPDNQIGTQKDNLV